MRNMKFAISEKVVDFYLLAQHLSSGHQKQSLQKKRLSEYFPNKVLKEQCV